MGKIGRMEHEMKQFGWRRNLEYLKINISIMYKRILEYKSNFWSSFFTEILYFMAMIFFFKIILNEFDFIEWNFVDFFLYMVISAVTFGFFGLFAWKGKFSDYIVNGQLNLYVLKPMNTWTLFYFSRLAPPAMVFIIIDTLTLVFIKFYYGIIFYNIFLSLIIFQLIVLFLFMFYVFYSSFEFYFLKISDSLEPIIWETYHLFEVYPAIYFKNFPFKIILIMLPGFLIGSLLLPLLRNYEILNINLQVSLLVGMILFFTIGTWINWHYGLKKYEAFG